MSAVVVVAVTNAAREIVNTDLLAGAERVHRQLRPHLPDNYVERMQQVFAGGAEMAVAVIEGEVAGVTVFRLLVTDETRRSSGVGHALMRYMEGVCHERECDTFSLDSGTWRQQAHKFYFREGMTITSFHFDKKVSGRTTGIKTGSPV